MVPVLVRCQAGVRSGVGPMLVKFSKAESSGGRQTGALEGSKTGPLERLSFESWFRCWSVFLGDWINPLDVFRRVEE